MDFTKALAQALAPAKALQTSIEAEGSACPPVFVVREVINSSGGKTGCFLYRGTLAAGPPPRCATPEACCPLVRSPSAGGLLSGVQEVPQCGGRGLEEEEEQTDLQAYEGQELTLYMSYEEASPKMKQRVAAAGAAGAPWRVCLRDAEDMLVFCARGLPTQLLLDSQLHLAAWGSSIAVAFPTAEDAQAFASGVCQVAVKEVSLADSSAAAALACTLACSGAAPAPQSCPPSPARADKALVGGKRKAAEAGLMTPLVKPRLHPLVITPTCSGDLAQLLP